MYCVFLGEALVAAALAVVWVVVDTMSGWAWVPLILRAGISDVVG